MEATSSAVAGLFSQGRRTSRDRVVERCQISPIDGDTPETGAEGISSHPWSDSASLSEALAFHSGCSETDKLHE